MRKAVEPRGLGVIPSGLIEAPCEVRLESCMARALDQPRGDCGARGPRESDDVCRLGQGQRHDRVGRNDRHILFPVNLVGDWTRPNGARCIELVQGFTGFGV